MVMAAVISELPERVVLEPDGLRWHIAVEGEDLAYAGIREYGVLCSTRRLGSTTYRDALGSVKRESVIQPCERCIRLLESDPVCELSECGATLPATRRSRYCSAKHQERAHYLRRTEGRQRRPRPALGAGAPRNAGCDQQPLSAGPGEQLRPRHGGVHGGRRRRYQPRPGGRG